MMFGEQHLVRFGSMSKATGAESLATLQDSDLDPPQVCQQGLPSWSQCVQQAVCMHLLQIFPSAH